MSIEKLIDLLRSLNQDDILDFGEDYEGNPIFLIRNIFSNPCQLTIANFSEEDISDWSLANE
jgi:hypothetical protein